MLFTKIWTAVLAVLATACLAGMYLLSTGSSGGFKEADEAAVRAITEAGMAALASDINSSPVSLGPSVLSHPRLKEALDKPAVPPKNDDGEPEGESLQQVFYEVSNETLLEEYLFMSMAIVDKSGNILARAGFAPEAFDELSQLPALTTALNADEGDLLSATLADKLHAVKVSKPVGEAQQRRLITIQEVDLGGGSFFRRVVGTENPAGLVRSGELLGEPIGGAKAELLTQAVQDNIQSVPPEGASAVFEIGEGTSMRIASAARVPGPAGKGNDGTLFVVLSAHDLGATQQDMASALQGALAEGGLAKLNWPLVGGLLVISLVLTFYLPYIEYNTPVRRLTGEFNAITEGRQHELYHDTYGGDLGTLARSATTAMEALRVSWEQELMDSDADISEPLPRRTRSTRSLRSTRGNRRGRGTRSNRQVGTGEQAPAEAPADDPEAIDLPGAEPAAKVERHAAADAPDPGAVSLDAGPPAPAPAFNDELAPAPDLGDSDSVSLADVGGEDREGYYRKIYDEFVETKAACGESTEGFTYEKFAKKLRKQSDNLLSRDDVKDVQFSVYVKDGKAALRAKVIKS